MEKEKQFATYDISNAIKELGFNEPCLGLYHQDKFFRSNDNNNYFIIFLRTCYRCYIFYYYCWNVFLF